MSAKNTAFLLVADVVGTGVLGLGGNMGVLGWVAGLLVLVIQVRRMV